MLVLSRKIGEQVYIGSDIVVTVLEIQGQRVKIGIDAPRDCRVLRGELSPWHQSEADQKPAKVERIIAWVPMASAEMSLAGAH